VKDEVSKVIVGYGEIIDGSSSIDESMVTGESLPVEKDSGDQVIAGTINQSGSLRFRATKIGADTALAQIVRMVETAQNSKAPAQRLADRAAHYLTLIAVGSGVLTFLSGCWSHASQFYGADVRGDGRRDRLPDAGLATPTAVIVATDLPRNAACCSSKRFRSNRPRRSSDHLRQDRHMTEGKPRVTDVVASGGSEDELLRLARCRGGAKWPPVGASRSGWSSDITAYPTMPHSMTSRASRAWRTCHSGRSTGSGRRAALAGEATCPSRRWLTP
jgi:Cu2+-exporting ATPase